MLTFWALLDESDVEAYVGTLLLPSYMSHLRRSPFRFESQPSNPDGMQPLRITYLGEGRVEEFYVHPKKHASGLLQNVCPMMDPKSFRMDGSESFWNWSDTYSQCREDDVELQEEKPIRMRLYFEPTSPTLSVDFPTRFDPQQGYVSVSRREMFIGLPVLRGYFAAWIDKMEGGKGNLDRRHVPLNLKTFSSGATFQGERIGGDFSLEDDAVFQDLLHFAGLSRTLRDVADLVKLDLENAETEIGADGFRFRMVPV